MPEHDRAREAAHLGPVGMATIDGIDRIKPGDIEAAVLRHLRADQSIIRKQIDAKVDRDLPACEMSAGSCETLSRRPNPWPQLDRQSSHRPAIRPMIPAGRLCRDEDQFMMFK